VPVGYASGWSELHSTLPPSVVVPSSMRADSVHSCCRIRAGRLAWCEAGRARWRSRREPARQDEPSDNRRGGGANDIRSARLHAQAMPGSCSRFASV